MFAQVVWANAPVIRATIKEHAEKAMIRIPVTARTRRGEAGTVVEVNPAHSSFNKNALQIKMYSA